MIRVFKSLVIQQQLSATELIELVKDFKSYKLTGVNPSHFGRDCLYNHPDSLPIVKQHNIYHIHLGPFSRETLLIKAPFYRTSDAHLVYCHGHINNNIFLLMAILSPNAHAQARSRTRMFQLGTMAESFRRCF